MHSNPRFQSAGVLGLILAALATGCGGPGSGTNDDGGMGGDGGTGNTTKTLALELTGVPTLGPDYVYEGWLIVGGAPVSTGRFTVDDTGMPQPSQFEVSTDDASAATLFVLTIEPANGDDPAPADTHLLAGALSGGVADLTVGHEAALGTDFAGAAGEYILETPSTSTVADDADQGIWWLVPGDGTPTPGLTLPALPAGWVYEGWVVGPDGPISTGRFTDPMAADSDGAGPTAGPDGAPPFPGQDFIDPAVSLLGHAAVISVEPEPDDSPAPFAIKPLVDMEIEAVMAPATQSMGVSDSSGLPRGTARLE